MAFPAWALGHDPSLRIIAASYAARLARNHTLDCRAVLEAPWYRRVFPKTRLHPDKNPELEVMTTARGFRYATSIGGSVNVLLPGRAPWLQDFQTEILQFPYGRHDD